MAIWKQSPQSCPESILANYHRLFTSDDVNNHLPFFSVKYALKIMEVLMKYLEMFPVYRPYRL